LRQFKALKVAATMMATIAMSGRILAGTDANFRLRRLFVEGFETIGASERVSAFHTGG
jgi:hypothetical protein